MKIHFYAHACFRLEGDGLSVITDPYTPGPGNSQFEPINESADIVLMSSDTDDFHSDPSHIAGDPTVINTLDIPSVGQSIDGLFVRSFPVMESLTHDFVTRGPDDCALYAFTLGGIRVLHIGDVGNPIEEQYLTTLAGHVDLLFALTGGHATIALDDLDTAINAIQPKVVIPMHYYHPRGRLEILPVEEFTKRYPTDQVTYVGGTDLELTPDTLPETMHIYVLEQSR
ncbi:MAG: MBL fold metallo-hydrolase [Chloroflexota bacterium]